MNTNANTLYDSRKLELLFHEIRTFVNRNVYCRNETETKCTSTADDDEDDDEDDPSTKNPSYEEIAAEVCAYIKREFYPKYKSKKPSAWDLPDKYRNRLEDAYLQKHHPDLRLRLDEKVAKRLELKRKCDDCLLKILDAGKEIEQLQSKIKDLDGYQNKLRGEISCKKRDVYDTVFKEIERERNAKRRKSSKT